MPLRNDKNNSHHSKVYEYTSFSSSYNIDEIPECFCKCDYCTDSYHELNKLQKKIDCNNNNNNNKTSFEQNSQSNETIKSCEDKDLNKMNSSFLESTKHLDNDIKLFRSKSLHSINTPNDPSNNFIVKYTKTKIGPTVEEDLSLKKINITKSFNDELSNQTTVNTHQVKNNDANLTFDDENNEKSQIKYYDLWKSEIFKSKAFEKDNEKLSARLKYLELKLEKETQQQIKISLEWRKTVTSLVDENRKLKIELESLKKSF